MTEMFGLSEQEKSFLEETIRRALSDTHGSVWIFGSRAKGTHRKFSDIDVLIDSENLTSRRLQSLVDELEESDFPFKVDIVDFKKLAPEYRDDIESHKKLFLQF